MWEGGVPSKVRKDDDMRIHNRNPTPTQGRPHWQKASSGCATRTLRSSCAIFFTFIAAKTEKDGGSEGERKEKKEEGKKEREEKGKRKKGLLKGCFFHLMLKGQQAVSEAPTW